MEGQDGNQGWVVVESLEVGRCGCSRSWGAKGPQEGLSHEVPLGSQEPQWS